MTYHDKAMSERHAKGRREHGEKYDPAELDAAHWSVKDAYAARLRVKVQGPDGIRTGTVSTTTGWRPSFLLMHRSNSMGSSDVLRPNDIVIGTWRGRSYDDRAPYGQRAQYPAEQD